MSPRLSTSTQNTDNLLAAATPASYHLMAVDVSDADPIKTTCRAHQSADRDYGEV